MPVSRPHVAIVWSLAILLALSACQKRTVADRSTHRQAAQPTAPRVPVWRAPSKPTAKPVTPPPDRSAIPSQPPIPTTPEISSPPEDDRSDAVTLRPPPLTAAEIGEGTRIALMLPLSGDDADLGASMLRAAQLALFDIAGENFILMPYDTEGDPDRARIAEIGRAHV